MRSLRNRLLWGTALGTAAVLLVSGVLLYALIRRTLAAEFDAALALRAHALAALTEQSDEGLDFEPPEASLPEFAAAQQAEYYQVWRSDGTVFARSPSLNGGNLDRPAGRAEAPAFRTVRLPDGRAGRIVELTFAPREESPTRRAGAPMTVTLVVGRGLGGLQTTLARVRAGLLAVGGAAVAFSAGVLAWVVRRTLKPIHQLSCQIARVGETDLSRRIDGAEAPRELSPVIDRLNDLLRRLEAAFQRERRFTGDVAHELRTPLAGLRSKLELALSRARTPASYRQSMSDCLQIDLQMQRMVETLLHLARADAGQMEIRCRPVDLAPLIREGWSALQDRAAAREVRVEWRLQEVGPVVTDPDHLRLVLQNIFDNAVTYVDERGVVSVGLATDDGAAVLTVTNTGSRLPREQVQRVFDRFWRGDPSCRAAEDGHCGLGLPLCQAVMGRIGGSIAVAVEDDQRFTVAVRLPGTATASAARRGANEG